MPNINYGIGIRILVQAEVQVASSLRRPLVPKIFTEQLPVNIHHPSSDDTFFNQISANQKASLQQQRSPVYQHQLTDLRYDRSQVLHDQQQDQGKYP